MESIEVGRHYRGKYLVRDRLASRDTPWSEHYLLQNSIIGGGRLEIAKRGVESHGVDAALTRRLLHREVEMLSALRSRHVAPVYEFSEEVPEIVYGAKHYNQSSLESCLDYFQDSPASIEQKFDVAFALHAFVAHCHGRQILVGNLSPKYLLIFPKNADRIQSESDSDAQTIDSHRDEENSSLLVMGVDLTSSSPAGEQPLHRIQMGQYSSPEWREGNAVSTKSDVYSLGVILTALFEDTQYSDQTVFTGIQNATLRGLPELKELLRKMLASEPDDRPSIDEVRRELLIAMIACKERSEETGAWCPNCRAKVLRNNLGEEVCGNCRGPLKRVTRQLMNDSSRGNTAVERLYIAQQSGATHDVVFWARGGMADGTLTGNARLIALEAATELSSELEFAQLLINDFPIEELEPEQYYRYLGVLGSFLWRSTGGVSQTRPKAKQEAFGRYGDQWDQAVREQPENAELWRWCIIAANDQRRETIIRQALQFHPENVWLHFHMGELLGRQNRYLEALREWMKAVEFGLRDITFLLNVHTLVQQLKASSHDPLISEACEYLNQLLMSYEPRTAGDFQSLIKIARTENNRIRERDLLERGLKSFPTDVSLRETDAQTLYRDGKFEFVIKKYGDTDQSAFIQRRVALSLFELKDLALAGERFASLIQRDGTAADYYYLARCQSEIHGLQVALETARRGLQLFPDDAALQKLVNQLEKIVSKRVPRPLRS